MLTSLAPGTEAGFFTPALLMLFLSCLILNFCHFRLIKSLKETWMTKIPVLMFLSNFTVTEGMCFSNLLY